ncbi:LysR family transcriptional regulator [Nitrincola schmidtii]|uniref:LysR family transcriptional regulator n=1 Tax=Nitrincola schmidtii TaxID=1730894 RepID=UPI00124DACBB|nr:LysR family transcriptional regulator [Nitrincola schmidtii]
MKTLKPALSGQIADADIRLLRIFRTVVERGGFAAAEVDLNISRAAISTAMSDLEQRLSLRLCQRGRSGFSLTEEGREVYAYTLQLLSALEEFRTQVNSLHAHLKGELNIGITDNLVTMPQMHITDAIGEIKARGPEVMINIRMTPPAEIEVAVLDGRLHLGVVPVIKALPGLNYLALYSETSQLYCSHDHPLFDQTQVTNKQLATLDVVAAAYAQTDEALAQYQSLRVSATATDREGIAFLILTGRYLGFLPTHYADRWVKEGQMRAIEPEHWQFSTEFSAITRKGSRPNLILETYLSLLQHTIQMAS